MQTSDYSFAAQHCRLTQPEAGQCLRYYCCSCLLLWMSRTKVCVLLTFRVINFEPLQEWCCSLFDGARTPKSEATAEARLWLLVWLFNLVVRERTTNCSVVGERCDEQHKPACRLLPIPYCWHRRKTARQKQQRVTKARNNNINKTRITS